MYQIETDSSVSSDEERCPVKRKPAKKKTYLNNTADPLPYGRKRSCWKRNYSEGEKLGKSTPEAGVITCAICEVQRYYKFIKQTRKFGLHSCEPCRKFISAMIANVRNGSQFLFSCINRGPQNCMMMERISLQNDVKTKKDFLSNVRCKACWLALCLQKYEMHPSLKYSLAQFIAEDDRPSFSTFNTENEFAVMDLNHATKKRSQRNHSDKACIKVLTSNYMRQTGMLGANNSSPNKVIIFRIKDVW